MASCFWANALQGWAEAAHAGVQESLDAVARVAPTVVIRASSALGNEVGTGKLRQALRQLARFAASRDPDCQAALRIIGDAVPRVKAWVGKVSVDGDPSEWAQAIPPPDFARMSSGQSREMWAKGAAAVVHDDCLYVMAGLPTDYFKDPKNGLRIAVDCRDGPECDALLSVTCRGGRWFGTGRNLGAPRAARMPLLGTRGAIRAVAELAIHMGRLVPAAKSKPIWAIRLTARHNAGERARWLGTRYLPVLNDSARPGVAAEPYVAAFLLLCADAALEESDRTAAAIAIMSATVYQCGDAQVRKQVRRDNADFLRFARELSHWQEKQGTQYRLKDYPLEAQLAWAHRCLLNKRYFHFKSRKPSKRSAKDADNYRWASTSVDTLRKLQTLAVQEGMVSPSVYETAKRIDLWVRKKQVYSLSARWYRKRIEASTVSPAQLEKLKSKLALIEQREQTADVAGQFHGKPVSEFRLSHAETLLTRIQRRGRTFGACGNHTFLCRDLMRAVGIAEVSFLVEPSRSDRIDHIWPAHYDPTKRVWRSYQAGRKGAEWWLFSVKRIPVYTFAATAPHLSLTRQYQGPRPFPYLLSREIQGAQVKEEAQRGIATKTIREWMLTPCF